MQAKQNAFHKAIMHVHTGDRKREAGRGGGRTGRGGKNTASRVIEPLKHTAGAHEVNHVGDHKTRTAAATLWQVTLLLWARKQSATTAVVCRHRVTPPQKLVHVRCEADNPSTQGIATHNRTALHQEIGSS